MAMTQRERMIAAVTGIAVGAFALNYYAIDPYIAERDAVKRDQEKVTAQFADAQLTLRKQLRSDREWHDMVNGGLKSDASDAEQQLYEAVRDWARECGVNVLTSDPQRVTSGRQNDRTQIVRLRVTGTGTTASFSKLLWRVETSPLPVKVDEFTLTGQPPGTDNLAVSMAVSTIWIRPPSPDDAKGPRPGVTPRRAPAAGEDL